MVQIVSQTIIGEKVTLHQSLSLSLLGGIKKERETLNNGCATLT